MKEDEMVGTCSTYGRNEKCIQDFGGKTLKGRDHLEDLGVGGSIILE
jgi:hypothetical protein